MPEAPSDRLANTSVPIHPDLAARWSPRVFDPDRAVTAEQLAAVLEAARWAATWGQRQPVRFVVGHKARTRGGQNEPRTRGGQTEPRTRGGQTEPDTRGGQNQPDETFTTIAGLLKRGNSYARAAGALILVCADEGSGDDANERTARYAAVDAGAAIAQLTVEAVSRGLIAHPMAGFDVDGARAAFGIPEWVRPLAVVALGWLGDYTDVDEAIAERDGRPRRRLPLAEIAFSGRWGQPR